MMGRGADGGSRRLAGSVNVNGSSASAEDNIYSQVLKEVAADDVIRENPEYRGGLSFSLPVVTYSWKGQALFDSKRKSRAKKTQPRSRESKPIGKQRHKQRHDADDLPAGGDATAGQFWTQMDDYFRDVTTSDVQLLLPTTVIQLSESNSVSDLCLLIPPVGRHYTEKWAEEDLQQTDTSEQVGPRSKRKLPPSGSVSKKSKKSGELITIISPPLEHEDGEELCHVCNCGDSDDINQIIFCDICNVAVHQDCYGVGIVPEGQWLCSWCSWKASTKAESSTAECVLCPSKGGAVKPVVEVDSKETVGREGTKFAHLFCSQWVPETFIGNMEIMEPIRNIEGVRDERWRLLCSICKEKHGACIQCSHGMCAIAFHPLCAREAKLYMEVCSMDDTEDIEYRAYCSRHSAAHMGKSSVALNEGVDTGASQLKPTDRAEEFSDIGAPTGTGSTESMTPATNISSKEETPPSASVMRLQFVEDVKVSTGQPQTGLSNLDDASQISILSPIHQSGPSGKGLNHLQVAHQNQQGFEDTRLAASPSPQSREASQSPHSDNVNRLKQGTTRSDVNSSDKIEGESSLPKSGDLLDRRVSDTTSEGSKGQDAFEMGGGDASGEVAIVWDEKGSEERRQRGLSGEASTSHFYSTSLSDSPAVPAQTSNFPSTNEPNGKQALDPTIGVEVFEEKSPTEDVQLDTQQRDKLQKDLPQPYAHPQIVQRLRQYQQSGWTNRQLLDTESSVNFQKSSNSPVRAVEDDASESSEKQWEQLRVAEKEGVLKLAPDDEIEGEILVLQNSLLSCAEENRLRCEELIIKLMPKLSEERASSLKRVQELSFVHRYMSQKREAKKLGRKEKRNKEAQAVLAAATAAAAASPRVGYIKRDALSLSDTDNQPSSPSQEITFGHNSGGLLSSSIRHLKPPVPRLGYISGTSPYLPLLSSRSGYQARTGTELAALRTGHGHLQLAGEEPACDVCNIRESSRANKIVACSSCKVNVHQECYGIGRVPPGLWFCQPCAELQRQSQSLRSPGLGVQANILWAQCALCCRGAGALKRSTDGRWVHVFCAQWMPETSTGKDQSSLIQGMESMNPERFALLCSVCQRQEGACLTCNFGHCHGAFHPPCARDAGLYMTVRVSAGGRLQYRAYCDRHSTVQRSKDEQVEQRQRSGNEELHTLRQIRVEFERVRLMCERICRRERLKRDMLQTTKEIALGQLLSAAQLDISNLEQPPEPIGINRGDTSTIEKELSLASIQQISNMQHHNSVTDTNPDETREHTRRHKKMKKHGRTRLHREQLMTPMEASILNMRLPKGYAYVPVDVYVKGTITPTQSVLVEKEQQLPPSLLPP